MKSCKLLGLLRLGRMEFAGGYFSVMLSGALSLRGSALHSADLIVISALALLTALWTCAHNDCCDFAIDRRSAELSNRPLVSGAVSMRSAWLMVVILVLASFVIVVSCQKGVWSLLALLACAVLSGGHNQLCKKLPGADALLGAAFASQCLLGALLVAGSGETAGLDWRMVWVVVVIQFFDPIVFNAGASLKDVRNDRAASAVTAAVFLGVTVGEDDTLSISGRFKSAMILLKLSSLAVLLLSPFWTGIPFSSPQILLIGAAAAVSLFLTVDSVNVKVFDRPRIGRHLIKQEAASKLLVALLLMETAGWRWSLVLFAVPIAWYFACNVVLYGRGLSFRKEF